jgi:hypothetical protein
MNRSIPAFLALFAFSATGFTQTATPDQFRTVGVDAREVSGVIRSFQGLNGPPYPVISGLPNLVRQYRELRIGMVRTHDSMGPTEIDAHYSVDNPFLAWLVPDPEQRSSLVAAGNASSIFPDWNADPEKPESYNFGPSDKIIRAIRESGAEVYFRIGRSFGAEPTLPADFDKFAAVIKHVAMHYNQSWANGFHDKIRYWEFWNEPDIGIFWKGTPEQFYALYEKTAHALKSVDPSLQVGGTGKAFALTEGPYREGFLDYCAAHHLPLDFYSWHTYADFSGDPYDAVRIGKEIRGLLDAKGFKRVESHLTEWNLSADFTDAEKPVLQGMENAAFIGAVMIYLQDSPIDHAHFYRGDAAWMGLYGLQGESFKPAHAFRATAAVLKTPERLTLTGADTFGFAALAGRSRDGKTVQILISNYAIPAGSKPHMMQLPPEVLKTLQESGGLDFSKMKFLSRRNEIEYRNNSGYNLTVTNLPWGRRAFTVKRYRLTKTEDFTLVNETSGSGGKLELSRPLPPPGLELIVLRRR